MAPIVHGLEAKYYGRIGFAYLDIDNPDTEPFRKQFGFRYQPYFVLLDGEGNVLQQWVGVVEEADFIEAFEAALGQ